MENQLERDVNELWALVFRLVLDGEKLVTAQLAEHDLTTPQFYVLKTLSEQNGHCAIGQIARLHGLTNATMTGLVKRLEAFEPPLVMRETKSRGSPFRQRGADTGRDGSFHRSADRPDAAASRGDEPDWG